jgi:hypothetical protein
LSLASGEGAGGFRHAPYSGGPKPFSIGLAPIDLADWIEIDARLAEDLALKESILAEEGAGAFDALPGSEAAQAEAAERLADHLTLRFPEIYRRESSGIRALASGALVDLASEPPLLAASRLVQEDLLLMQSSSDGWRLTAGSLCFPSTWRLGDKLGRAMAAIHEPVPGFAGPMAARIDRIFSHLRSESPLERFNVSVYGDARLRHAEARQPWFERFPPDVSLLAHAHIRIERQTLSRLPRTGAILFTVRIHLDPIAALASHAAGARLAGALKDYVGALGPEQLAYKGLLQIREKIVATLGELSEASRTES